MKAVVFVDGFNLYYRALRNTPNRWLDLGKLAHLLLPGHEVTAIRYYTARVSAMPGDPDKPTRQQLYLRALRTLPELSITFGQFRTHSARMPLAADPSRFVEVLRTDEKGSDVNLAAHLVYLALRSQFELAAVISNDSDLAEPIRLVAQEVKKPVVVLCPAQRPARELLRVASEFKRIRRGALEASQFAPVLTDEHGGFHRPAGW
ncbi:MAG: NYN domain-containing protein [Elusimicrobia bacterium]|nr:NYN domain-containing protein [Elusimicrobiota bacterium]